MTSSDEATAVPRTPEPDPAASRCHIRRADPRDVVPLAELFGREAEHAQRQAGYFELEPGFDWPRFVAYRLSRPGHAIFVAEQEGRLVGFLYARLSGSNKTGLSRSLLKRLSTWKLVRPGSPVKPRCFGIIEQCFVLDYCRRRGIGMRIAGEAFAWMREQGTYWVELSVIAGNEEARLFWEALGFHASRVLFGQRIPEK